MDEDGWSLFGTDEPAAPDGALTLGALTLGVGEHGVRAMAWNGVELVRAIDYPIRDAQWGTLRTRTVAQGAQADPDRYRFQRAFETEDGCVAGQFELDADEAGRVAVALTLELRRDVELCRAGFTILHPIDGLAGELLTVLGSGGRAEQSRFPLLVAPAQPASDIVGLSYAIGASAVSIEMEGEVFEMEDQRNWTDASYKTYGRTATFPFPFTARAGSRIEQRLTIRCSGAAGAAPRPDAAGLRFFRSDDAEPFPELALAVEAQWSGGGTSPSPLDRLRRVLRLDLRREPHGALASMPAGVPFDLELIVSDDRSGIAPQMRALRQALAARGASPEHVLALPAAYLRSYQPDGTWPAGAGPADAITAARQVFPEARIGGGVLTNFTELNRCRPPAGHIDYLTHGTSAIVHAADDGSVFQTLEALPHIFRSARALAPGRPYRLGLTAMGSRSNPYGAALAANPERRRVPMTDSDPRAGALFGAAWLVGVAAATEGAGIELLTLAGEGGPFAVAKGSGVVTPAFHVLRRLAAMQKQPRLRPSGIPKGVHAVAVAAGDGATGLLANGTAVPQRLEWRGAARLAILDAVAVPAARAPDWLDGATSPHKGPLTLPPYAIAFFDLDSLAGQSS